MKKRLLPVFGILAIIVLAGAFFSFNYFINYYGYGSYAKKALKGSDDVSVSNTDDIWFFDGPGTDRAFIFYPGANVATEAYAPLMQMLAAKGTDCFLVGMPLHCALFGKDRAALVTERYSYDEYIIGGHSLGGVAATEYLSAHPDDFSGEILLASYPTIKISDDKKFLSILGSNDGVINTKKYEACKKNWPSRNSHDYLIFGGNHAGFGNYGKQDGEEDATIKQKTQWRQTVSAIEEYY